ncbi:hypothetical protein B4168_3151 [Anoxybacillus flavithermus]|nr:hypothetical protein B4168_3151 [Anoxybacillus flavithermus]OAO86438.1 hypothetical protein GT23_2331 [Parageobacillus thermoglucosidasius]
MFCLRYWHDRSAQFGGNFIKRTEAAMIVRDPPRWNKN